MKHTAKSNGRHTTHHHAHALNGKTLHAFRDASIHLKGASRGLEKEFERYMKQYSGNVTQYVKKSPIKSLLISTAVGVALGAIFLK